MNAEERAAIERRIAMSGMTTSAFLRRAALGAPIRSVLDQEAVPVLARVNADLSRLGNLLKVCLGEGADSRHGDIPHLLREIQRTQSVLRAAAKAVKA